MSDGESEEPTQEAPARARRELPVHASVCSRLGGGWCPTCRAVITTAADLPWALTQILSENAALEAEVEALRAKAKLADSWAHSLRVRKRHGELSESEENWLARYDALPPDSQEAHDANV